MLRSILLLSVADCAARLGSLAPGTIVDQATLKALEDLKQASGGELVAPHMVDMLKPHPFPDYVPETSADAYDARKAALETKKAQLPGQDGLAMTGGLVIQGHDQANCDCPRPQNFGCGNACPPDPDNVPSDGYKRQYIETDTGSTSTY